MALESLKKLSLNELLSMFHASVKKHISNLEGLSEQNKAVSLSDVLEIKDHIRRRITEGQNTVENQKILQIVDLFNNDRSAIAMMRASADEWLEFLDVIQDHIAKDAASKSATELKEISKIQAGIAKLKNELRKE